MSDTSLDRDALVDAETEAEAAPSQAIEPDNSFPNERGGTDAPELPIDLQHTTHTANLPIFQSDSNLDSVAPEEQPAQAASDEEQQPKDEADNVYGQEGSTPIFTREQTSADDLGEPTDNSNGDENAENYNLPATGHTSSRLGGTENEHQSDESEAMDGQLSNAVNVQKAEQDGPVADDHLIPADDSQLALGEVPSTKNSRPSPKEIDSTKDENPSSTFPGQSTLKEKPYTSQTIEGSGETGEPEIRSSNNEENIGIYDELRYGSARPGSSETQSVDDKRSDHQTDACADMGRQSSVAENGESKPLDVNANGGAGSENENHSETVGEEVDTQDAEIILQTTEAVSQKSRVHGSSSPLPTSATLERERSIHSVPSVSRPPSSILAAEDSYNNTESALSRSVRSANADPDIAVEPRIGVPQELQQSPELTKSRTTRPASAADKADSVNLDPVSAEPTLGEDDPANDSDHIVFRLSETQSDDNLKFPASGDETKSEGGRLSTRSSTIGEESETIEILRALETQLDTLNTEKTNLNSQIMQMDAERAIHLATIANLTAAKEQLSRDTSVAVAEKQALFNEVAELTATIGYLRSRLEVLEEQAKQPPPAKSTDAEVEFLNSRLLVMEARMAKLQKENDGLRTQKLQLLDKALDLKMKLKSQTADTSQSSRIAVTGKGAPLISRYEKLPKIGK